MNLDMIVFVYAKDGKCKILSGGEAKLENDLLLNTGWVHTSTINITAWLEQLVNGKLTLVDFANTIHELLDTGDE